MPAGPSLPIGFPLVRRRRLSAADLEDYPWVVREPGSGTRSEIEAALSKLQLSITNRDFALELPSNEAVRAAIEAGAGIGGMSELVAAPGLAAGTLHRLPFDMPRRSFLALAHRERRLSKASEALIAICAPVLHKTKTKKNH